MKIKLEQRIHLKCQCLLLILFFALTLSILLLHFRLCKIFKSTWDLALGRFFFDKEGKRKLFPIWHRLIQWLERCVLREKMWFEKGVHQMCTRYRSMYNLRKNSQFKPKESEDS